MNPDDLVLVRRGDLGDAIAGMAAIEVYDRLDLVLEGPAVEVRSCADSALVHDPSTLYPDREPFDLFWSVYPRRNGKKAAARAWEKAMKDARAVDVIVGAIAFAAHWADQPKNRLGFIPYPATWLNAGSWDDELVPHATEASRTDTNRQNLMGAARSVASGESLSFAEKMRVAGGNELGSGGA